MCQLTQRRHEQRSCRTTTHSERPRHDLFRPAGAGLESVSNSADGSGNVLDDLIEHDEIEITAGKRNCPWMASDMHGQARNGRRIARTLGSVSMPRIRPPRLRTSSQRTHRIRIRISRTFWTGLDRVLSLIIAAVPMAAFVPAPFGQGRQSASCLNGGRSRLRFADNTGLYSAGGLLTASPEEVTLLSANSHISGSRIFPDSHTGPSQMSSMYGSTAPPHAINKLSELRFDEHLDPDQVAAIHRHRHEQIPVHRTIIFRFRKAGSHSTARTDPSSIKVSGRIDGRARGLRKSAPAPG